MLVLTLLGAGIILAQSQTQKPQCVPVLAPVPPPRAGFVEVAAPAVRV